MDRAEKKQSFHHANPRSAAFGRTSALSTKSLDNASGPESSGQCTTRAYMILLVSSHRSTPAQPSRVRLHNLYQ